MNWLAEGFGVLALVINFIGYRQNNANSYRIVSALALACLSVHFFMLGAMAAGIVLAIGVVRNFVALRWQGPVVLWVFVLANLAFMLWEWFWLQHEWPLFVAYASSLIFTVGSIRLNNATLIRKWFILAELLGLIYAVLVGSVSGLLFNIVNLSSISAKLWQDGRALRKQMDTKETTQKPRPPQQ